MYPDLDAIDLLIQTQKQLLKDPQFLNKLLEEGQTVEKRMGVAVEIKRTI